MSRAWTMAVGFLLGLAACGGDAAAPEGSSSRTTSTPTTSTGPGPTERTPSNAGTFVLAWDVEPDPLPLNGEFAVRFRLEDAEGRPLAIDDEAVRVDADMPEHGHGMTVAPTIRREGDTFVAEPMLFHMGGRWEIYVDVTRGTLTERAQFPWDLE